MEAELKIILAVAACFFLSLAPASAQFAESLLAPGGTGPCGNCTPEMQSAINKARPAAVGGPVGSPTFVMPAAPAASKGSSVIDISPAFADWLQPYIVSIVNALILAAMGWAANWMRTHWNIDLDEKQRTAITTALQNQAGSLIADGKVKITSGKLDVHSDALANAANDLLRSVPDAATHFGVTPEWVSARILDTIPQIAAGAQMIAQHHAANDAQTLP